MHQQSISFQKSKYLIWLSGIQAFLSSRGTPNHHRFRSRVAHLQQRPQGFWLDSLRDVGHDLLRQRWKPHREAPNLIHVIWWRVSILWHKSIGYRQKFDEKTHSHSQSPKSPAFAPVATAEQFEWSVSCGQSSASPHLNRTVCIYLRQVKIEPNNLKHTVSPWNSSPKCKFWRNNWNNIGHVRHPPTLL